MSNKSERAATDHQAEESPQEKRKQAIKNVEKVIGLVMGQINRKELASEELKYWAKILGDLSGVLNNLLREAEKTPEEEEGKDLVSLLDKIPKQFTKPAEEGEELGDLVWKALLEAVKLSNHVLRSRDYPLEEKRRWAAILPELLSALIVLGNVTEEPAGPAIKEDDLV